MFIILYIRIHFILIDNKQNIFVHILKLCFVFCLYFSVLLLKRFFISYMCASETDQISFKSILYQDMKTRMVRANQAGAPKVKSNIFHIFSIMIKRTHFSEKCELDDNEMYLFKCFIIASESFRLQEAYNINILAS